MRFPKVLSKNLKVLFRSKESAFIIIFGPLLIITLVGFAFTNTESVNITVGVHAPEYTDLTREFIAQMNALPQFSFQEIENGTECIQQVRQGQILTCLVFPPDFEIADGKTNTITFYVDDSRSNLVFEIREAMRSQLNVQRSDLSQDLTDAILQVLSQAETQLTQEVQDLANIQNAQKAEQEKIRSAIDILNSVELVLPEADIGSVRFQVGDIEAVANSLREKALEILDETDLILRDYRRNCDGCDNETLTEIIAYEDQLEVYIDDIAAAYNNTPDKVESLYDALDSADSTISEAKEKFERVVLNNELVITDLTTVITNLDNVQSDVQLVKDDLQTVLQAINELEIRSSDQIVNPIVTQVETVTPEVGQEEILYPYLLILVIMFISLMLPSMLVVMEKTSRARFRNFTTPTGDLFIVLTTFLTTLIILCVQVIIIVFLSSALGFIPLFFFANSGVFGLVAFFLFTSICFFSLVGMCIGYLSPTQEASTIASISLGSIFLFLSNLVLPLEKLALKAIADYNPYVVFSELIKKSILFGELPDGAWPQIGVFLMAIVALFLIVLTQQKMIKKSFFSRGIRATVSSPKDNVIPLHLSERTITSLDALLEAVQDMTRAEYEDATVGRNLIALWVKKELKQPRLAKKLEKIGREQMIRVLSSTRRKK